MDDLDVYSCNVMCGYLDVPAVEGADDVDLGVAALVPLVHNVDDVVCVVDPETEHGIKARAGNEPSRSLKVQNHAGAGRP